MRNKKPGEKTSLNNRYLGIQMDVANYSRYLGGDGFGNLFIRYLPLSKSYGEHPYWLISKLEFILEMNMMVNNDRK